MTERERFEAKIEMIPFHACWEWNGFHQKGGYAVFQRDNRKNSQLAHRYSFELRYGEIPAGFHIDHICRNRGCINPLHLRAVTPAQNVLENSMSIPAQNKKKTHCHKGHEYTAENTMFQRSGRMCRLCHRESGRIAFSKYRARNK